MKFTETEKQFLIETLVALMSGRAEIAKKHYTVTVSLWEINTMIKKIEEKEDGPF